MDVRSKIVVFLFFVLLALALTYYKKEEYRLKSELLQSENHYLKKENERLIEKIKQQCSALDGVRGDPIVIRRCMTHRWGFEACGSYFFKGGDMEERGLGVIRPNAIWIGNEVFRLDKCDVQGCDVSYVSLRVKELTCHAE